MKNWYQLINDVFLSIIIRKPVQQNSHQLLTSPGVECEILDWFLTSMNEIISGKFLIDHEQVTFVCLFASICCVTVLKYSDCSSGPDSPRRLPGLLVSGQHRLQHDHELHRRKPVFMRAFPHFLALLGRRRQIRPHRWRSPTPRR